MSMVLPNYGIADDYPLLWKRARLHDHRKRFGGGDRDPLGAEIEAAIRECWAARRPITEDQGRSSEQARDTVSRGSAPVMSGACRYGVCFKGQFGGPATVCKDGCERIIDAPAPWFQAPVTGIVPTRDATWFFTTDHTYIAHHPRSLWRRIFDALSRSIA